MRKAGTSVEALEHGLTVLACFASQREPLSISDLVGLTGLQSVTIYRIVYTLNRVGYLYLNSATDRFQLGPEVLSFAGGEVGSRELCDFAAPLMEELVEATNVSASIGIRQGFTMTCIEARRSRAVISLEMHIGTEFPLDSTAIGRAYLAACDDAERAVILRQLGQGDAQGTKSSTSIWTVLSPRTNCSEPAAPSANGSPTSTVSLLGFNPVTDCRPWR